MEGEVKHGANIVVFCMLNLLQHTTFVRRNPTNAYSSSVLDLHSNYFNWSVNLIFAARNL